jgi:hypothetical protein
VEFAVGLGVGEPWMVFIGVVRAQASPGRAEEVGVRSRSVLAGYACRRGRTRRPALATSPIPMARVATAPPGEPLDARFERLARAGGARVLVFDRERLVGITGGRRVWPAHVVTATDIARAVEVRAPRRADHGWASQHDKSPARG